MTMMITLPGTGEEGEGRGSGARNVPCHNTASRAVVSRISMHLCALDTPAVNSLMGIGPQFLGFSIPRVPHFQGLPSRLYLRGRLEG